MHDVGDNARSRLWDSAQPRNWKIATRSAVISAVVVLFVLGLAGAGVDLVLYRLLLDGVDDATAARVQTIAEALQSKPFGNMDSALMKTDQHVVAIQVIDPSGAVVLRSGSAPDTPLLPVSDFGTELRRGIPDDAVPTDDMRMSGQRVDTVSGHYTVLVGGGSEAVEETARTVALLLACGAPIIVAVAATATYRLVRRSLHSVDAIRRRVAAITTSDLAQRVPVSQNRDEIAALAITMNEMLARIEAGQQAQRRLVADASHELRSPLATIISGLEIAEIHPGVFDAELAARTLLPEAQRMQTLVEDLLLLARADERRLILRKEEISLGDLAEIEATRVRRAEACTIETDIGPAHLTGDPVALSRVVRNLVDNAVRHANSRVGIEVSNGNGTAVLSVSDDGPGIPPTERRRVFERFVRLDADRARSGGGAGLGLAIVAEVVTAHSGTVAVDDRPGGGTTMTVTLPQHLDR